MQYVSQDTTTWTLGFGHSNNWHWIQELDSCSNKDLEKVPPWKEVFQCEQGHRIPSLCSLKLSSSHKRFQQRLCEARYLDSEAMGVGLGYVSQGSMMFMEELPPTAFLLLWLDDCPLEVQEARPIVQGGIIRGAVNT